MPDSTQTTLAPDQAVAPQWLTDIVIAVRDRLSADADASWSARFTRAIQDGGLQLDGLECALATRRLREELSLLGDSWPAGEPREAILIAIESVIGALQRTSSRSIARLDAHRARALAWDAVDRAEDSGVDVEPAMSAAYGAEATLAALEPSLKGAQAATDIMRAVSWSAPGIEDESNDDTFKRRQTLEAIAASREGDRLIDELVARRNAA